MRSRSANLLFNGGLSALAWFVSAVGLWALSVGPEAFEPTLGSKYRDEWLMVVSHGLFAIPVLAIGPLLLLKEYYPRLAHRQLGKLYLGLALFAALTSVPLSFRAEGGPPATLGFLLLALLWLRATWAAYDAARKKNFQEHKRWVKVHYLLAFSAVFQRWGLAAVAHFDLSSELSSAGLVWLSWQPGFWLGWYWKLWSLSGDSTK